jgi:hypothetical protein
MEEAVYYKTLMAIYKTTWQHVPYVRSLLNTHGENIKISQN